MAMLMGLVEAHLKGLEKKGIFRRRGRDDIPILLWRIDF